MSSIISLSMVGIIVAFLISVLVRFPVSDMAAAPLANQEPVDESFSIEAVHQAAGLFSSSYTSLIDDLISFQKDPDYARAESRREEMVDFGSSLTGMFQDFEGRLQSELDILGVEADELATETSSTTTAQ